MNHNYQPTSDSIQVAELGEPKDILINFDLETSCITPDGFTSEDDQEIQVVYLVNTYAVNIHSKEKVSIFHRNMTDFISFLLSLTGTYTLYAHNLNYELSFLLNQTKWTGEVTEGEINEYGDEIQQSIFRSKKSPIRFIAKECPNLTFKCSLALLSKTVSKLGKEQGFPKLDYDYSIERLPWDELTPHDYAYCERDNIIVSNALLDRMHSFDEDLQSIPLTFTSATKKARYEHIQSMSKGAVLDLNTDSISVCKEYEYHVSSNNAYQGGFTSAHHDSIGKVYSNVGKIDITSSYPYSMCIKRFPIYSKKHTTIYEGKEATYTFLNMPKNVKGFIATMTIKGLSLKDNDMMCPLSHNFCMESSGVKKVNGKIISAESVTLTMCNIDFDWLSMTYNMKNIDVSELITTTKSRFLKYYEVSFLLKNFNIKQNIDKDSYPMEYALAKVYINAMYGVKVQCQLKDFIRVTEGKVIEKEFSKMLPEEQQEVYERFIQEKTASEDKTKFYSKYFDIFSDGMYITAFSKLHLLQMHLTLLKEGFKTIYVDTDSITVDLKKEGFSRFKKILERENFRIKNENIRNPNMYKFLKYEDIKGDQKNALLQLGQWDIENECINGEYVPLPFFKTLGAKKYAYVTSDNKIHTTVSGLSKNVGDLLDEVAISQNWTPQECLDYLFKPGTLFEEKSSGRTVASYEKRSQAECLTLTKNGIPLNSCGGIIIKDTTYLLNISKLDGSLISENNATDWRVRISKDGNLTWNDNGMMSIN